MAADQLRDFLVASEGKRQRRTLTLTPDQRLARFGALQATAMRVLASNPAALAAFHQRNRRCRRQSQVQALLTKIQSQQWQHEQSKLA